MYKVGEKFQQFAYKYPWLLQFLNKVFVYFAASLVDPIA
jgi:hypothetical protein